MKADNLHNFISPVTGRVLSGCNYVLIGNSSDIAISSPILIDIRLDLINLKNNNFIIGFPDNNLPNTQVLSNLKDGLMVNLKGKINIFSSTFTTSLATYILQTPNKYLTNAQSLINLSPIPPNIVKIITGGIIQIAVPNMDTGYVPFVTMDIAFPYFLAARVYADDATGNKIMANHSKSEARSSAAVAAASAVLATGVIGGAFYNPFFLLAPFWRHVLSTLSDKNKALKYAKNSKQSADKAIRSMNLAVNYLNMAQQTEILSFKYYNSTIQNSIYSLNYANQSYYYSILTNNYTQTSIQFQSKSLSAAISSSKSATAASTAATSASISASSASGSATSASISASSAFDSATAASNSASSASDSATAASTSASSASDSATAASVSASSASGSATSASISASSAFDSAVNSIAVINYLSYGALYLTDNTDITYITANTYTKLIGTTSIASVSSLFESLTDNRLNYTGESSVNVFITANISIFHNVTTGTTIGIGIYKNGVQLAAPITTYQLTSNHIINLTVSVYALLNTNDYIEVWGSTTDNSECVAVNMNFLVKTIPFN